MLPTKTNNATPLYTQPLCLLVVSTVVAACADAETRKERSRARQRSADHNSTMTSALREPHEAALPPLATQLVVKDSRDTQSGNGEGFGATGGMEAEEGPQQQRSADVHVGPHAV